MYVIRNRDDETFWSNTQGWVDLVTADVFNEEERRTLNPPLEGDWVRLSNFGTRKRYLHQHFIDQVVRVEVLGKNAPKTVGGHKYVPLPEYGISLWLKTEQGTEDGLTETTKAESPP